MENDKQHHSFNLEGSTRRNRPINGERRSSVGSQLSQRRRVLSPSQVPNQSSPIQACAHSPVLGNGFKIVNGFGTGEIPISLSHLLELRQLNDDVTIKKRNSMNSISSRIPRRLQENESMVVSKLKEQLKFAGDDCDVVPHSLRSHEYAVATKLKQMFDLNQLSETQSSASDTSKDTVKDDSPSKNHESDIDSTDDCESHDLEYGFYLDRSTMVRAYAVHLDPYLPSAVEYDADCKPPMYRNRRFQLYACLIMTVALIGILGVLIGIALTYHDVSPNVPYRATLGIRENIERFVRFSELEDPNSPYHKALDWITHDDPMSVTPDQSHFIQRYIIAYLYFATSTKQPWNSGCAPIYDLRGEEGSDRCTWSYMHSPSKLQNFTGHRWLSGASECDWAGIDCDELFQVQGVVLSNVGMTGTFPEGIVHLPFLNQIAMAYGELEGQLPAYLANMKHLARIDLNNNLLTGTFPSCWISSRSLKRINVDHNHISGTIPKEISKMHDLRSFSLNENELEGTIPDVIGDMINLVELQVGQNILNGTIPTTIGNLKHLSNLWLFRNELTGTIPKEIGSCDSLTGVWLYNNRLEGTIPNQLWEVQALVWVDLFDNRLNGTISGSIGRMSNLLYLNMNNNQLTGGLPKRLGSIPLQEITLSGNRLTGTVPVELCASNDLVKFELDCAPLNEGAAPEISCLCCTQCCRPDGTHCQPMS